MDVTKIGILPRRFVSYCRYRYAKKSKKNSDLSVSRVEVPGGYRGAAPLNYN